MSYISDGEDYNSLALTSSLPFRFCHSIRCSADHISLNITYFSNISNKTRTYSGKMLLNDGRPLKLSNGGPIVRVQYAVKSKLSVQVLRCWVKISLTLIGSRLLKGLDVRPQSLEAIGMRRGWRMGDGGEGWDDETNMLRHPPSSPKLLDINQLGQCSWALSFYTLPDVNEM